ncbi:hypothetical protein LIC_12344 [Leptospira interrogans serovar Copenhageni str. Fiocruz L1-130]|uniref:Uncharacterized protein n=2 Tax=Leptospira interrogans serogroup Icterohaemorrhagiae serovar copenhageni TaxID=44275 RepID=Q72PX3_LEPIC|nr:hypothetical protein LIC_12344 [Leptospira interrogans serovar Copenhageni str. Fiocruz L1-130]EMG23960.1 hypothetical protein LEP1GSC150_2495 [Leptospira interrogans serovar Copenhageni str. LT2050]
MWEFPHFQNQTCYNQICGSSYRFHLYKFLNSHLFVIQLGMSSHRTFLHRTNFRSKKQKSSYQIHVFKNKSK